jgi:cytosine deaminase
MGLENYGIDKGCNANFVILQAKDPIEAIRLRATRLNVIRNGKVISETPANTAHIDLPGRPKVVEPNVN